MALGPYLVLMTKIVELCWMASRCGCAASLAKSFIFIFLFKELGVVAVRGSAESVGYRRTLNVQALIVHDI